DAAQAPSKAGTNLGRAARRRGTILARAGPPFGIVGNDRPILGVPFLEEDLGHRKNTQVWDFDQGDVEFSAANKLFHQDRRTVVLQHGCDAAVQAALISNYAALIETDAGVLGRRFDDYRPFQPTLRNRQVFDDKELRSR